MKYKYDSNIYINKKIQFENIQRISVYICSQMNLFNRIFVSTNFL